MRVERATCAMIVVVFIAAGFGDALEEARQVFSTLANGKGMTGGIGISYASTRNCTSYEECKSVPPPQASGVYYWAQGTPSSGAVFAPCVVTAYNHSGIYGDYVSDWQHHAVLDKAVAGSTINYMPVVDRADAMPSAATYTLRVPPLSSALGGDAEQRTVIGLVGDLGQTGNSTTTLKHIQDNNDVQVVLLVGDLSYADNEQPRWDSWRSSYQQHFASTPLVTLPGNHEVETCTKDEVSFKPYASRFRMAPQCTDCGGYLHDGWKSNMWFSITVGSATVFHLSSYHPFDPTSEQFRWLQSNLASVDRNRSPWLIVCFHAPFYNSNYFHQEEVESLAMRQWMEPLFLETKVDIIFAGHVHAYERMHPTYNNETNVRGAPTYVNIGDGGNREGIYDVWLPGLKGAARPVWSAVRKGSYGHGVLTLENSKEATWAWHRNEDLWATVGDEVKIRNQFHQGSSSSSGGAHGWLIGAAVVTGLAVVIGVAVLAVRLYRKRRPSKYENFEFATTDDYDTFE